VRSRYTVTMFEPQHNTCIECGSNVALHEAQQLVTTDREHWYRIHQTCFDNLRKRQSKEALALVSASGESTE
jgi:hypothetical protein